MFSKLSDRDAFGYPNKYRSAIDANLLRSGNDEFTKLLVHFDESNTIFTDTSAGSTSPQVLTNTNTAYNANGRFNGCADFTGGNHKVVVSASSDLVVPASGKMTIEGQFKVNSTNSAYSLICTNQSASAGWFDLRPQGFSFFDTNFRDMTHGQTYGDNNWHHVRAVQDGTTILLFFDGILRATLAINAGTSLGSLNSSLSMGYNVQDNVWYPGLTDEIRFDVGVARSLTDFTVPTSPYV
jgi:hypothetical protein